MKSHQLGAPAPAAPMDVRGGGGDQEHQYHPQQHEHVVSQSSHCQRSDMRGGAQRLKSPPTPQFQDLDYEPDAEDEADEYYEYLNDNDADYATADDGGFIMGDDGEYTDEEEEYYYDDYDTAEEFDDDEQMILGEDNLFYFPDDDTNNPSDNAVDDDATSDQRRRFSVKNPLRPMKTTSNNNINNKHRSNTSLTIRGALPTAIPSLISSVSNNLSSLPSTISMLPSTLSSNISNGFHFGMNSMANMGDGLSKALSALPSSLSNMSVENGSIMVISVVMAAVFVRTVVLGSGNLLGGGKGEVIRGRFFGRGGTRSSSGGRKKTRKNKRKSRVVNTKQGGASKLWARLFSKSSKEEEESSTSVANGGIGNSKYGDYSEGYPGEEEPDDGIMDLDDIESEFTMKQRSHWMVPTSLSSLRSSIGNVGKALVPKTANVLVENVWIWMCATGEKMGVGGFRRRVRIGSSSKNNGSGGEEMKGELDIGNTVDLAKDNVGVFASSKDDGSKEASVNNVTLSKESTEKVGVLQNQLDTLTKSHESLEQEYEASLRMLHEARMELRQLQSQRNNGIGDTDDSSQKKQMEAMVKKLESKYKQQMKDQVERVRGQMEGKLRSEMEVELQEKVEAKMRAELEEQFEQQMEARAKEMQESFDAELQRELDLRVDEIKREKEDIAGTKFQEAINEAVAHEVDQAVEEAVQQAVQREQQKARDEMIRVRQGIQKVLERERRLMKEQVKRSTGQVREWVKQQQMEQLARREEQLQEEVEQLQMLEEEEAMGDRRRGNARQGGGAGARRSGQINSGRYGSSFYDDRKRAARPRDMDDEDIPRSFAEKEDYYEDVDGIGDGQDESMQQQQQRRVSRDSPSSEGSGPRNVYKQAAQRKQQQRRK
jgi:hypothetical protein|eukprot:g8065.t1 g8065   contig27:105438-108089(+)